MLSGTPRGAATPTSGCAPAPRPLVHSWPMFSLMSASHMASAWASVLAAMNSTPRKPLSTMRLTALVPPPPTPTTLMTARYDPPVSFIDTDSPSLGKLRRPRPVEGDESDSYVTGPTHSHTRAHHAPF